MPFLVLLVWYQALVTGNPLHATYAVISGEEARLSIVLGDIIAGARFTLYRAAELATWISPILGGAYACCLFAKVRSRTIRFYDLLFPSFFLGFVFFPELGGNRYGPRYYFETFPLMVVTIASGVGPLVREWRPSRLRSLAFNGAAACVTYLLTALTAGLSAYHRQVESRHEPFRLVESRSLSDAIVIVRRGVNDGMISLDYPRNDPSLSAPVLYARPATTPEQRPRHRQIWQHAGQQQAGLG